MARTQTIDAPEAPPEADRLPDAPHPRTAARLFGQEAAEREFLAALGAGRLHHGWMIVGPRGIGKATLAWRIARRLIADPPSPASGAEPDGLFGAPTPPDSLELAPDHPVARRIAAGSEPGLLRLTRPWDDKAKRFKQDITVEEVRRLKGRLSLSAADGGWRVCIVDAADEMNRAAANAFLKLLEEPPARTTMLLVAHQPSALLPTIRSRCRLLRCAPLGARDMAAALAQAGVAAPANMEALSALSAGSVGRAVTLASQDGLALYGALVGLLGSMPRLDRPRAVALADSVGGPAGAERRDLVLDLLDLALTRLARRGALGALGAGGVPGTDGTGDVEAAPGEAEIFARLAPDPRAARAWATETASVMARARHGRAVNLDPGALILDTLLKLSDLAAKTAA